MYLNFILDFTVFWMSSRLKGVVKIQIQEIYSKYADIYSATDFASKPHRERRWLLCRVPAKSAYANLALF